MTNLLIFRAISNITVRQTGLPIVIHPEEAAKQVDEEDEAIGEHEIGDMEEFREYVLDGPRTADDQDCFSMFIVVERLKKS